LEEFKSFEEICRCPHLIPPDEHTLPPHFSHPTIEDFLHQLHRGGTLLCSHAIEGAAVAELGPEP